MRFGAEVRNGGTRFKIWAPKCKTIKLKLKGQRSLIDLDAIGDGWHRIDVDGVGAGTLYKYVLPDGTAIPDPTSRHQPEGIHGYSEVIDPRDFVWTDRDWKGRPWEEAIIYELHVGTITEEGTFAAAASRLDHLVDLGVTAVQIMPVAEFYGKFNWGYDGAMWFAPSSSYRRPEDLKAFVDAAHRRSMMVFLDVVYNHFGPHEIICLPSLRYSPKSTRAPGEKRSISMAPVPMSFASWWSKVPYTGQANSISTACGSTPFIQSPIMLPHTFSSCFQLGYEPPGLTDIHT